MARHSPAPRAGGFVAGITAAALAVVAFFAYQAASADDRLGADPPAAPGSATPEGTEPGGGEEGPLPLPAESGEGRRVVYALEQRRVWLVEPAEDGPGEVIAESYRVYPSAVSPPPGTYEVTSRTAQGTGSDGVPMEHAVVFHVSPEGVVFGFSAALDGSTPDPSAGGSTGGIRQSREDGDAMWLFATTGVAVVVVP
ncbi:hypothetical protein RM780_16485 [Streptomyces sp. DSM 44917]|uniref:L,D-transpeptidase n=1 Tax=Streptomyces boetiae TaxID=3075541 RepID=A0ABU2LBH4_9ACTN|nr:hypothetical protein [Streptomyces sp. DSM 44917]MDT0308543.1 hypothetical protein [Streptomyces sp. DSM 44917]